ncbi:glycosyltransferase family 4 protein [Chryseobacterium oryzae]|uniref:Glycosyltransferase family 4 protein n=1 Tax=Chryseobacterium oryzae TaxID=2929799 RepID=A0ABY4BH55_9FLAO|nr:glycosyltransferase family 1 protein [Chryseobacterium oryzae]UOE38494.1 glycosyltransferase family 4 protein [Chryseobacterium oryzae]
MKKRILIDVERLKYPKSGIANVCFSLIKGFNELKSDFDFSFYGPEKNIPQMQQKFHIIPWKFWQKKIAISTKKFNLIHTTHQLSDYFHHKRAGQKKIVTLHDLNFLHDQSSNRKINKSKKLVQKNIGNADAIVCISEFVKKDFIKNKPLFNLKKDVEIEVIYNGLQFPDDDIINFPHKFDFISKKFILTIGVLFPKKNQQVLLDMIAKNDRDLVVITSGSKSDYKDQFLAKIKDLNLEKRVYILENVSNEEKYFLLKNCEGYCHPSLAEGFGIPPVEAMYFGKPVFLSRLTSLPEIGGNLAFYFDDFDAEKMNEIYLNGINQYNSDAEMPEMLHKRALGFGYKKMAEAYEKLYAKMLS